MRLTTASIKRFVADWSGNYLFFVPVVGVINFAFSGWTWDVFLGYAITSLVVAAVSGRAFTVFLRYWYKAWGLEF